MPPRQSAPSDNAAILAKLEAMDSWLKTVAEDSREARDGVRELRVKAQTEDLPRQLEALRGEVKQGFSGARQDLVNTSDKITREMRDGLDGHAHRIADLEAWKQRIEGANGLVKFLTRYAPWLVTAIAAIYAYVHGGGKMP